MGMMDSMGKDSQMDGLSSSSSQLDMSMSKSHDMSTEGSMGTQDLSEVSMRNSQENPPTILSCDAGQYKVDARCDICPENTFSVTGESCVSCPVHMTSEPGSSSISQCRYSQ